MTASSNFAASLRFKLSLPTVTVLLENCGIIGVVFGSILHMHDGFLEFRSIITLQVIATKRWLDNQLFHVFVPDGPDAKVPTEATRSHWTPLFFRYSYLTGGKLHLFQLFCNRRRKSQVCDRVVRCQQGYV